MVNRVTEAEGRISELKDALNELNTTVYKLTSSTGILEARAEDAENRARGNNLCFIGFPEGVEGAMAFLEDLLRTWVPAQAQSTCFILECVIVPFRGDHRWEHHRDL